MGTVLCQTQEEKEKVKKEKVITNQTLKELKGNISVMGREEEIKEEEKTGSEESSHRDFYSIDDPARRDQIQVKIVEGTRKLEEAEKELEKAKKDLEDFLERARKEGALPGWIR